MAQHDPFHKGDHIEITAAYKTDDFGTIRGTAMDDREHLGDAYFIVVVTSDGIDQPLKFNLNRVNVKLLFDAEVARRLMDRRTSF